MEVTNMKRIEKRVKYLAGHMDEYSYEEFANACQETADEAWKSILDEHFCKCTVQHLANLQSIYRYTKMGMYE